MSKQLIIVRHGNTFLPDQIPTRVGGRTDLPLVEQNKAKAVAHWLSAHNIIPDQIYAAPLLRTMQTAQIIRDELGLNCEILPQTDFVEIDYGPDENKTEAEVINRLGSLGDDAKMLSPEQITERGKQIIKDWDNHAIVPSGWKVDVKEIISAWRDFADSIPENTKVLVCTSNGIIRFSPEILEDKSFLRINSLKVSTGSISIFSCKEGGWTCDCWNVKPS